jgi:hypothetical protein
MALALFPLPADPVESTEMWGHVYRRPQTSNLGVRVPDLSVARSSLAAADIPIVRQDERAIVVHPQVTGGVVLIVVEDLLPGDPRGALTAV